MQLLLLVLVSVHGDAVRALGREGLLRVDVAHLGHLLHDLRPDEALFHRLEQVGDRLADDDGVQLRDEATRQKAAACRRTAPRTRSGT